ncbi:hypothetical protein [Paenibacillus abyssi]|uniref:SLH domain-containing protein n=1 Tax=Paenibacillus abyssi TaxID=1340531 RepID=A0A917CKY6_9BACL|nr:hypothetical protein [Paenibacillus abyssi]GGF91634.1 hypothetical protein GCM10010916_06180 [Paenibacillus abyssi]
MRETSNNLWFKQNSQQPQHFRGGEKKVMKKSLSLLVAIAMVFSMFASVASAATSPAGAKLQELGIIQGDQKGDLMEGATWKRQDLAVLLSRLLGVEAEAKATAKSHTYTDVRGSFYDGFLSWAKAEGYMEGHSATRFGFDQELTYQQFAAVVLRALGVDTTGANYANVKELAVEAGIVTADVDFAAPALRGATYASVVVALDTEVAGSGQKLGTVLGLPGYEVTALAIAKTEQTNTREITVSFNKEVTAAEKADMTFEVKSGLVNYTVTAKWAENNQAVALSSTYLPAGEYEVVVKGFDAQKVTVADERPAKIEITSNSLQKADNQDLGIKLFNQFGKEIANPVLNVTVFNATKQATIAADITGKYDLAHDDFAKIDDNFVVTVTHSTGLSATKTFKIVAGSAATAIKLGTVAPLEGKVRVTAGDDALVLPIELTDQYGATIKLAETAKVTLAAGTTNFTISGITFMLSEADVVTAYAVDKDGKLTIDVDKAATLVINAVNPSTGATATTTVKVEGAPVVKTLQLSNPGVLVVADEEVKIPYAAVDNFNAAVVAKDIVIDQDAPIAANAVTFNSNVAFATGYPKINGKGELIAKFAPVANDITAYIYAYVNGAQVGQLQLAVKKAATPVKINGIKDVPLYFAVNAEAAFNEANITYLDNYNRTKTVAEGTYTVTSATPEVVEYDAVNEKFVAKAVGKSEITVNFTTGGTDSTKYVFTIEVVKADDIKSYAIKNIGTIYGKSDLTSASAHAKTVELVGKLSNGTEVALVQADAFNFVTTSDSTKVGVDGKKIFGLDEGTVTIAAYKGATKLAEQTVTVSEAAPIATTVAFNESEYTINANTTFVVNATGTHKVTVKDQYGVEITTAGLLASSDSAVATVSGLVVTKVGVGQTTLTYITANNVSATATLIVE